MSSIVTTAHLRTNANMRTCPSEVMLHLGPLLPPPDPPDEEKRLQTMRVLGLDAETWPPDPMLDTMCTTVGKIMDMPQVGEPRCMLRFSRISQGCTLFRI